jgi:hypothetical protein
MDDSKICLFDLDGTLADHNKALFKDLKKLAAPEEPPLDEDGWHDNEPPHIKERIKLIRSQRDWWLNLDAIPTGMDIYHLARKIGFQTHVLTKGPSSTPHAWTEKVLWVRKHLFDDVKICISEEKSTVYGRVLVDDWVPYIEGWLYRRPRGHVIMPAHNYNKGFTHPRVVRWDGTNLPEIEDVLQGAYNR